MARAAATSAALDLVAAAVKAAIEGGPLAVEAAAAGVTRSALALALCLPCGATATAPTTSVPGSAAGSSEFMPDLAAHAVVGTAASASTASAGATTMSASRSTAGLTATARRNRRRRAARQWRRAQRAGKPQPPRARSAKDDDGANGDDDLFSSAVSSGLMSPTAETFGDPATTGPGPPTSEAASATGPAAEAANGVPASVDASTDGTAQHNFFERPASPNVAATAAQTADGEELVQEKGSDHDLRIHSSIERPVAASSPPDFGAAANVRDVSVAKASYHNDGTVCISGQKACIDNKIDDRNSNHLSAKGPSSFGSGAGNPGGVCRVCDSYCFQLVKTQADEFLCGSCYSEYLDMGGT